MRFAPKVIPLALGLISFALLSAAQPSAQPTSPPRPVPVASALRPDDGILFYGNAMVERLLESGDLEARLQLAHPDKKLRIRSLAWTGDEVGYRLRPEGYVEHLKTLLAAWPAQVVVLGYGMNESFAGSAGLAAFRAQYQVYLREIARLHPGAKLVLLSPIAVEERSATHAAERNRDVSLYAQAIADLAREQGATFIDLFTASRDAYARSTEPLTTQGLHLNAAGTRAIGDAMARALLGDAAPVATAAPRLADLARAAALKHTYVAELVRPKNAALYYGVRKRPEENAAELPRYHQLVTQADAIVHDLAAHPTKRFAD